MTVCAADDLAAILERARRHACAARDADAMASYLEVLRRDPAHFAALNELGTLAHAAGYRSAARTAYEQAARFHPGNPVGRTNLGNMFYEDGDLALARNQFEAALAADAGCAEAHRGLARVLTDQHESEAAHRHWRRSFSGQAIAVQPYRGSAPPVPVLLLVSAKGGNVPLRHILDDRIFAVTALYVEFHDPSLPLPPHELVFNAIGDADLCPAALARAEAILTRTTAPVVNPPRPVAQTGRVFNAARLARIPSVRTPAMRMMPRATLRSAEDLTFPLLLRALGFHTGEHFLRVERRDDLDAAVAQLPGAELLAIEHLDARRADGMARKYRVMIIDGALYPLHLAISTTWKVHYFTADMADNSGHRAEERAFLEDMPAVLGPRVLLALHRIGEMLGLDYAGIDFALDPDGSLLFFEANATMVITPPPPDPIWDYRRAAVGHALDAARRMLLASISKDRSRAV